MVPISPQVLRALTPACLPAESRIRTLSVLLTFEFVFLCAGLPVLDSLGVLTVASILASPSRVSASLRPAAFAALLAGLQLTNEARA